MARQLMCDICRKPTNRIVAKLMLIPVNGSGYSAADYTAHADVGECCGSRLPQMAKFRRRVKRPRKPPPVAALPEEVKVA